MGEVRDLLRATRTSRRRMMKIREPRGADMMLYAWLVVVILIRFSLNCAIAVRQLHAARFDVGSAITEFSMLHLLLIVFLLTFLSSTLSLGAGNLDRGRLALLGVPTLTVVRAQFAALISSPLSGVAFLFALPAAAPLFFLPHPAASLAALLLCFAAALLAGAALGNGLARSPGAHRVAGAFRFVFAAVMLGLVAANFDFQWSDGAVTLFVFQKGLLLSDTQGGGLLSRLRPESPSAWILNGWLAPSALLAVLMLVAYALASAGMPRQGGTMAAGNMRSGSSKQPSKPVGIAATLFRHELRHAAARPSGFGAVALGLAFALFLVLTPHPTIGLGILDGVFVLLTGFSAVSNSFGYDGGALRRYALLNPGADIIFWAKNRAWLILMGMALVPGLAVLAARTSPTLAGSLSVGMLAVLVASVLWGNLSSLLFPIVQGGGRQPAFANQLAPFVLCAIPWALHAWVAPLGSAGFAVACIAFCGIAAIIYARFLKRIAGSFDAEVESTLARF